MNKDFLVTILTLTQGIKEKNKTIIDTSIIELNGINQDDQEYKEYMRNYFKSLKENIDTIISIVNKLNNLNNKESLLLYLELSKHSVTKDRLKEILSRDYEFDTLYDKHEVYTMITQVAISYNDPEIIKLAIDKIQTI